MKMENHTEIIRHLPGARMSRAVVHNHTAYLSGFVSDNLTQDFKTQMMNVLDKIDQALRELGSDKTKMLSALIMLRDISQFDEMNQLWEAWVIPLTTPARATFEARMARPEYLVEIMVTAAV